MSARRQAVQEAGNMLAYHRSQQRAWRRMALALAGALTLALAALAGDLWLRKATYIPIAATPDGRLIPLTPLDEPIMSDAALKNWTVSAVTEAFTLGHHDWRMRLSSIRENFTDSGYESFLRGLNDSLFLARLRDNLQVASAAARGAPVITDARVMAGRVGWAIEFPIVVTFAVGRKSITQDLIARALVMRVPLSERVRGIAIEQLIATKGRG